MAVSDLTRPQRAAPAIDDSHDAGKQGRSNHGAAFTRQMDKVDRVVAQRNIVIINDHINRPGAQPTRHLGDVGCTLLPRSEEAQIVSTGLQDRDLVPSGTPVPPENYIRE